MYDSAHVDVSRIRFNVHVHPRSRVVSVGGSHDGSLIVRVHALAVDDAANRDVLAALAQAFAVRRKAVSLARGERSREKTIVIEGDTTRLSQQLGELLTN
jgi:uncharacterized protein